MSTIIIQNFREPLPVAEDAVEEITEKAAAWVEWRTKQCDFPKGINKPEYDLMVAVLGPKEARSLLGDLRVE